MEIILILVVVAAVVITVLWEIQRWQSFSEKNIFQGREKNLLQGGVPCPLCGATLRNHEKVYDLALNDTLEDQSLALHGCPYCYPFHPHRHEAYALKPLQRCCPLCKRNLGERGVTWVRIFQPIRGKFTVSHLGCQDCKSKG